MAIQKNSRNIWFLIYDQVHEHLRESDKKRDQVIAFYLVLLAALIGAWDKFSGFRDAVLILSWVVGLACFVVATHYHRWHILLSCCMVTIQRLILNGNNPSLDECKSTWNAVNDTKTTVWALMNPLRGVETAVIYFLAFMTSVPADLLWICKGISIIVFAILYTLVLVFFSSLFIKRFYKFRECEWIFRWLRPLSKSQGNGADTPTSPAGLSMPDH